MYVVTQEHADIFYTEIRSSGQIITYKENVSNNIFISETPKIVRSDNESHIVWSDKQDNNNEIYYKNIEQDITNRITFSDSDSINPMLYLAIT